MSGEEWRPFPLRPDRYEVSSLGRVRSTFMGELRILKPSSLNRGYLQHKFTIDGKRSYLKLHRMVALTFLGEPTGEQVRHLDGNPSNNAVTNLAYGSKSDNTYDSVLHGTHNNASKTHCKRGHLFDASNTRIYKNRRTCLSCERWRRPRYEKKPEIAGSR